MKDNVNHPEHYQNIAGVEAIDILNDVVKDLPGAQAAMLWNTLKYLLRFQKKNGVEDLKKAQNYLQYLINDIETCSEVCTELYSKGTDDSMHKLPFDEKKYKGVSQGSMRIWRVDHLNRPTKLYFKYIYDAKCTQENIGACKAHARALKFQEVLPYDIANSINDLFPETIEWKNLKQTILRIDPHIIGNGFKYYLELEWKK